MTARRYSLSCVRKPQSLRIKSCRGNTLEIKNQGDTVKIRTTPSLTISDYTIGSGLTYEVPTPIVEDFVIDKAKSFAFQVHDILKAQADIDMESAYLDDAAKQLKIAIADEVYFNMFIGAANAATETKMAHVNNYGNTAGVKSSALVLGTDASPVDVSSTAAKAADLLATILKMGAALDEQNVPESGRWLLMTPFDRQILMQSNLAQAYFTGDQASIVRTGKIGMIDRFTIYVSNMLPRGAQDKGWVSGQTDTATGASYAASYDGARRLVVAGTKDAIAHASQISKVENVPNNTDFGTLVRGLNVYGRKVIKPEALAFAVVR